MSSSGGEGYDEFGMAYPDQDALHSRSCDPPPCTISPIKAATATVPQRAGTQSQRSPATTTWTRRFCTAITRIWRTGSRNT